MKGDIDKHRLKHIVKAESRKNTLDYHKEYYKDHSEALSNSKKSRYQTDPAYRQAAIARARASYKRRQALEHEIQKLVGPAKNLIPGNAHVYCPTCHQPLPRQPKPIYKSVDRKYAVAMYTIREVSRRLGKQVQTVQVWLKNGTIPDTLYRDRRQQHGPKTVKMIQIRLWTQDQVEMLMRVFESRDLRPPVNYEKNGIIADVKKGWDLLLPLGIDPSLYTAPTEHGLMARPSPVLPELGSSRPVKKKRMVNTDEQNESETNAGRADI